LVQDGDPLNYTSTYRGDGIGGFWTIGVLANWLQLVDNNGIAAIAALASQVPTDGASLVGIEALASTLVQPWTGLVPLTLGPSTLRVALGVLLDNLVPAFALQSTTTSESGSTWIGVDALSWGGGNIAAGTLRATLTAIVDNLPIGTAQVVKESGAISVNNPLTGGWQSPNSAASEWQDVGATSAPNPGDTLFQEITAGHGETITQVRVWVIGQSSGTKPTTNPGTSSPLSFSVVEQNIETGAQTSHPVSGAYADTATNGTGAGDYGARHAITSPVLSITINRATSRYFVIMAGEYGTGSSDTALFFGSDRTTSFTAGP
jgi:hypothetical protein